jgi:hypothetical protein
MTDSTVVAKPKIFAFSSVVGGGDGIALAMAEDGTVVDSHYCSNEAWVPHDLGVTCDWHHEEYKKHYPDGFEMEFVRAADVESHAGLIAAFALNQKQAEAAKAAEAPA